MAQAAPEPPPEPWLRGPLPSVPPVVMPVFFSFAQVREDLQKHLAGLTDDQVWRVIGNNLGRNSIGFHLRHIAGSVDRLTTYLAGSQLSPAQLDRLKNEHEPGVALSTLLTEIERALSASESVLFCLGEANIFESRTVGRRMLPTTVLGLLVHLAEHTQRHLGQLITLAQVVRELPAQPSPAQLSR